MDITSDCIIDAPVETVWALTLDVESWPDTTPTMDRIERLDDGPLRVGSRVVVEQPMQRPTEWTVTVLEPGALFVWSAKVGPVTMTATHRLTPEGTGCRNRLEVELTGFGSGVARRLLGGRIRQAIETENQGFKRAAERSHRAAPA